MLSRKYKFIFVHVPKTGGTSIEKYLQNEGVGNISTQGGGAIGDFLPRVKKEGQYVFKKSIQYVHLPIKIFQEYLPLNDYFKFSFVRNPWDRCVSEYSWRKTKGLYFFGEKRDNNLSFKEFIKEVVVTPDSLVGGKIHYIPQHNLLCDKKNNLTMDFIGRFENIDQDFKIVCEQIGIKWCPLSHLNISKRNKKYWEYYDDETRELVAKKYAKDIEVFNYKFI